MTTDDQSNSSPNKPRRSRSGSETRKKCHQVSQRYDADEYAEIVLGAERAGLTLASHIRACALERPPTTRATRRPTVEVLALTPVLAQLGRIGGNIHQLLKLTRFMGPAEAGEIHAMHACVRETCEAIMAALGRAPKKAAS